MYNHLEENGVTNIDFLQNNAYEVEDYVICGTRGWYVDEKAGGVPKDTDYQKIVNREVKRLDPNSWLFDFGQNRKGNFNFLSLSSLFWKLRMQRTY